MTNRFTHPTWPAATRDRLLANEPHTDRHYSAVTARPRLVWIRARTCGHQVACSI